MAQQQAGTDLELEANEVTKGLRTLPMGPAALTSARPAWPSRAWIPRRQALSGKEKGRNANTCTLLAARIPALTSPLLTAWRACKLVACGMAEKGATKPKLVLLGAVGRSALITPHIIDMITIDLTNGMIDDEGTDMDVATGIKDAEGMQMTDRRTYEYSYLHPLYIIYIASVCGTKTCNLALTSPCPPLRCWRACTPVALGASRTMPTEAAMAADLRTPPALVNAIINSSPYGMNIDARRYIDKEVMSAMPGGS